MSPGIRQARFVDHAHAIPQAVTIDITLAPCLQYIDLLFQGGTGMGHPCACMPSCQAAVRVTHLACTFARLFAFAKQRVSQ